MLRALNSLVVSPLPAPQPFVLEKVSGDTSQQERLAFRKHASSWAAFILRTYKQILLQDNCFWKIVFVSWKRVL